MDYLLLREEPLKTAVRDDFFKEYDYTQLGNIDFVIASYPVDAKNQAVFAEFSPWEIKSLLWAEAKQGTMHDIYESFVQLILTVGKARTFEKYLPPKYIGAFDAEKIAFIEYHKIQQVFYQNDFNWNVAPSKHESKEFRQLYRLCRELLEESSVLFRYSEQGRELREFIRKNFRTGKPGSEKITVTKNNFTFVFQKWCRAVQPTIGLNWEKVKKSGIIAADFFLADLISEDNLFVVLEKTHYQITMDFDERTDLFNKQPVPFTDGQAAHRKFWGVYARPPKQEYWDYIIMRRDLLVPLDFRERKGSFFTPREWVEKSQQYLAAVLGEDWQNEYYVWDCCAGTGNLLNGLTNFNNVWASTIDKADVDVMTDLIRNGGWHMAENHVFQFDFLNDGFDKCPEELREILSDESKRRKLVIYINPPYAEAATTRTKTGTGEAKDGVARGNKVYERYGETMGGAANEIFAEFLIRIYEEIQCCKLAQFATLKALCAPNFAKFRAMFQAELKSLFVVPANTFDNVNGQFPIGFFIWDTGEHRTSPLRISADVYDRNKNFAGTKTFAEPPKKRLLMDWLKTLHDESGKQIAYLRMLGSDVQNNGGVFITITPSASDIEQRKTCAITEKNFLPLSVYFAVRHSIEATWLNDRDQFLYPRDGWQDDREFQLDCLVFTLFHGQNRISASQGVNHWIPFTREQVGCTKTFRSNFMGRFLGGEAAPVRQEDLFPEAVAAGPGKTILSPEAQSVYDAGLSLWKYYHSRKDADPDASFYDIRRYFQGVDGNGRMRNGSGDADYTALITALREKQKLLAKKIEAGVYRHGFLLR